MTHDAFDSLTELATILERLCSAGRSGTVHIVTNDNHTAYFGLLAGQIVSVRYRIRKDMRALEHILKISSGSYTFKENAEVESNATGLPITAEILALLEGARPSAPTASRGTPAASTTVTTPSPPTYSGASTPQRLADSTQAVLLSILTHYAGPAANFMGRGVFAKTSDASEAIELLAQKIPDPSKAQSFVTEAREQLGHLL